MKTLSLVSLFVGCTAAPLDPPTPPLPAELPSTECPGHALEVRALGLVTNAAGAGLAGVPIARFDPAGATWIEVTRTGADGRYAVDVPAPAWLGLPYWRAQPGPWCVGIPTQFKIPEPPAGVKARMAIPGNDFVTVPVCTWRLRFGGAEGTYRTVVFRPGDRYEVDLVAADERVLVEAPCDATAVALFGASAGSLPSASSCDAPTEATCLPRGGGDLDVDTMALHPLRISTPDGDEADLTDGLRTTRFRQEIVWPVGATTRLRIDLPLRVPAVLAVGTGRARYGILSVDSFRVDPPRARIVAVDCAVGEKMVPCPASLGCGGPGADAGTCRLRDDRGSCSCPMEATSLGVGGRRVDLPPAASAVVLPLGEGGGGVRGRGAPGSRVLARRAESILDLFVGPDISARRARCDERGAFEILGLAPGHWEVVVGDASPVGVDVASATVELP